MKPDLTLMPHTYAIAQLGSQDPIPDWVETGEFWAVVRTGDELSLVCLSDQVPDNIRMEPGWRILKVAGPLDFSLVGILADLAQVLADAGASIFVISTFDTDYILIRQPQLTDAMAALQAAGYHIRFCQVNPKI